MGQGQCPACPNGISTASSVLLTWDGARGEVKAIKVQCQVLETSPNTYFSLINFRGGYIGIQDYRSWTGRFPRCIFSIWDAAGNPTAKYVGANVDVNRFSGEGTGMQMIDDQYGWTLGTPVSCIIIQVPSGAGRVYGGFINNGTGWKHIGSIQVDGAEPFGDFYSFVEDFGRDGLNVKETRKAGFYDVWMMDANHRWYPASGCSFSQSTASNEDLEAVESNPFGMSGRTLENGGGLRGQAKIGQYYPLRPGENGPPRVGIELPDFPRDFQKGWSDSVRGMFVS